MRLSGFQFSADADDKHSLMLFGKSVLPFLRGQAGIHILQLLSGNKRHLSLQFWKRAQLRID